MIHYLSIVLALVGVGFMSVGIYGLVEAAKSKRWPIVYGIISKSGIKETRWDESVEYSTDFEYAYTVADKMYTGWRITWAPEDITDIPKKEAEKLVDQYPAGEKVTVHYDPANPTITVLDTRISMRVHAPWIIGFLLVLTAFGLYYFSYLRTLFP